ncbi:MAG TPA: PHP domain-containing protein, partial [Terriglobales bacterium]|nr:PHP domain-containing protein [Terriglobales bacterium]
MYSELHARSAFSFLQGASLPEEMAEECARLGLPALALLDADGVYGAPRFHLAARRLGLRAHIGSEIMVSGFTFQVSRGPRQLETCNLKRETSRLPLLVESRAGYQNLCRLITRLKLRAPKHAKPEETAARLDDLATHAAGLICLTGGDNGPLAAALAQGGADAGRRCLEQLIALFGRDRVYVELQRHFERSE